MGARTAIASRRLLVAARRDLGLDGARTRSGARLREAVRHGRIPHSRSRCRRCSSPSSVPCPREGGSPRRGPLGDKSRDEVAAATTRMSR
eukprot:scaffold1355_cov268-Pinguiococcus_pyrenoidosus.AAC.50